MGLAGWLLALMLGGAAEDTVGKIIAEHKAARDRRHKVSVVTGRYRITVGTTSDLFFHVRAQGDSWEDVITQLAKRAVVS